MTVAAVAGAGEERFSARSRTARKRARPFAMLSATRSHWLQEIGARHVAVDVYIVEVDEALIHEHLPA